MVRSRKSLGAGFARLRLDPDPAGAEALAKLAQAYDELAAWLDTTIPAGHPADQVALHRAYYESARRQSGLPAQLTTLALRDWAMRRRGDGVEGVPLDERLYSIRESPPFRWPPRRDASACRSRSQATARAGPVVRPRG